MLAAVPSTLFLKILQSVFAKRYLKYVLSFPFGMTYSKGKSATKDFKVPKII